MKNTVAIILISLSISAFSQNDTLTFQKAINIALENNYGVKIQEKSVEISQTNNTWGNAGALPTVSFVGNSSESLNYYENDDANTSNLNASVNLDWVVFRGFGAKIQKMKLDEFEKLSETSLSLVIENTIINVTLAYYGVLLQEENVKLAEKVMLLSEDRFKKEKNKKDLGSSITYNLLQAQNSWLEDKSNYLSAKSAFNNSVRQLNYLMAAELENKYLFVSEFEADTADFELDILKDKMLSNNKSLQNQYINLEMAKLDVKSAKSAYYPTVSASVNGGYNNSETEYSTNTIMNQSNEAFNTSGTARVT